VLIGHYSAAFALKGVEKDASLGWLFLAVQFADLLFFPFVLLGIERMSIIPHYTEATHFRLEFMPYSHGLVASLLWAAAIYGAVRVLPARRGTNKHLVGLVLAAAALSHWVLDLIAHTPDLPLLDGGSPRLGFGLWQSAVATYVVEAALLLAGLWVYLRATGNLTRRGRYGAVALVTGLLLFNVYNLFGPPPDSIVMLSGMALVFYFALGAAGFWLDRQRS
jgi:hypothetical protein